MDPADDSNDLSHLCSAALDLLKRFDKLIKNKQNTQNNGRSCKASRSHQPQRYSCEGQQCSSMIAGSTVATSGTKQQQRQQEKKPALSQEKKAPGSPPPPPPVPSLVAVTTNESNEAAPENSDNAASSSWQFTRLQPTEIRLILKLDTWMTSDGTLVIRPSVYEDRAAASSAGNKAEELATQGFSAPADGKQLQPPRGPAAAVKVTGNHGDKDETDGRTIVIPLCRQQLLQQKQLQPQSQQQQRQQQQQQQTQKLLQPQFQPQQRQQLQLQQHLQLQQLIEAQQQQQQKQQQPHLLHHRHSHVASPANLVGGPNLRIVSSNLHGTQLPNKTILLPVSTRSARRDGGGGGLQTSCAAPIKRRGAPDSFLPHGAASCLCGTANDGCCQVNNHHDNSNSESDNLSDQSDAMTNSFGSD